MSGNRAMICMIQKVNEKRLTYRIAEAGRTTEVTCLSRLFIISGPAKSKGGEDNI